MALPNIIDISIRFPGHNKYSKRRIIENDVIEVIVQKLEMILFTGENEVFGEVEDVTVNMSYYLWNTKMSNINLKQIISEKIEYFIPELIMLGYDLNLELFEGTYRDILYVNFIIQGYGVRFIFK